MNYLPMLLGKGYNKKRNSVNQIVELLIENSFSTKSEIQEEVLVAVTETKELDLKQKHCDKWFKQFKNE
jgi:hypothetical protein